MDKEEPTCNRKKRRGELWAGILSIVIALSIFGSLVWGYLGTEMFYATAHQAQSIEVILTSARITEVGVIVVGVFGIAFFVAGVLLCIPFKGKGEGWKSKKPILLAEIILALLYLVCAIVLFIVYFFWDSTSIESVTQYVADLLLMVVTFEFGGYLFMMTMIDHGATLFYYLNVGLGALSLCAILPLAICALKRKKVKPMKQEERAEEVVQEVKAERRVEAIFTAQAQSYYPPQPSVPVYDGCPTYAQPAVAEVPPTEDEEYAKRKIKGLKKLRDMGAITAEQYQESVNQLLEKLTK